MGRDVRRPRARVPYTRAAFGRTPVARARLGPEAGQRPNVLRDEPLSGAAGPRGRGRALSAHGPLEGPRRRGLFGDARRHPG